MKVYFVGAGPGDPELLTVKGQRMLKGCRIRIYAGSLINPEILKLLPADAEKHDSAGMNLDEIIDVIKAGRDRDLDVVRLHSGDPSIYGSIKEQMQRLDQIGADYEVIPGVSSFQASAAALKTELTAPETSRTIILTRTSGRTPMPDTQELEDLAKTLSTLCIFLSAHKVAEVTDRLAQYYGSDCPAAIVYRASWPDQLVIRSTPADIAAKSSEAGIKKTALIVVGRALSSELPVSKLCDPGFTHEYRVGNG